MILWRPSLKIKNLKKKKEDEEKEKEEEKEKNYWEFSSVVDCLSSMHKVPAGSSFSTAKTKKS